MTDEIKKEPEQDSGNNGKHQEPKVAPTDFKIAEIYIRDGQVHLDAVDSFFNDKFSAIGVLELCKDIVKQHQTPKPKIIQPKGNMFNFIRNKRR